MAETNSLQDLAERYERVKNIDQQKNKLIDVSTALRLPLISNPGRLSLEPCLTLRPWLGSAIPPFNC